MQYAHIFLCILTCIYNRLDEHALHKNINPDMCIYDQLDERAMQKNTNIETCIYDPLDKSVSQKSTTAAYRQGQREVNRKMAQSDQK